MGFPRQEYWRGLPLPSAGNLPDPGSKTASPALAGRFFTTETPGKPRGLTSEVYMIWLYRALKEKKRANYITEGKINSWKYETL